MASTPMPDGPSSPPSTSASPTTPREDNIDNESTHHRQASSTSTIQGRLRSASKTFKESSPPAGFMIASSQIAASLPTLSDIRRGSYTTDEQVAEKQRRESTGTSPDASTQARRKSSATPGSPREAAIQDATPRTGVEAADAPDHQTTGGLKAGPSAMATAAESESPEHPELRGSGETSMARSVSGKDATEHKTTPFANGYEFPPKHTWAESTAIFLKVSWGFFITPIGFLVTIYGLNIVAWGGMLFLLLCNAAPAMCKPTCNDINSPRRIWIEIDSQILNALFCVTGFGTIPWRFRDLYYLMQYRIQKKELGLRRLAGINRGWFRLAGSQELPVTLGPAGIVEELPNVPERSIPFPVCKISDAPLTGNRAPPTAVWKLDFVIWSMVWNTILQAILSGFMWGMNRFNRPSWSTGLFVALACIVAGCGGIMSFVEGKHVKAVEGVPVSEADQERLRRDRELGIIHYNNLDSKKPKEKGAKTERDGLFKRRHRAQETAGAGGVLVNEMSQVTK